MDEGDWNGIYVRRIGTYKIKNNENSEVKMTLQIHNQTWKKQRIKKMKKRMQRGG